MTGARSESSLVALALRIEQATEGSRELDRAIHREMIDPERVAPFPARWDDIPAYTSSMSDALLLYKQKPERVPSDPLKACAEALRQWT